MSPHAPKALATSLFQRVFASQPTALASAPGRVNLIGEHTDYNGGPALPFAIERRTVVAAAPATAWQAVSTMDGTPHLLDPSGPPAGGWTDYVRGVIRVLQQEKLAPSGARIAVASSIPIGAGLSSSAALAVSLTKALTMLSGRRAPPALLAELAYRAEHDEVGVRCGRMDQTVAALATRESALLFESATGEVRRVPLLGRIIVMETGVERRLIDGQYNQRRKECEEAVRLLADQELHVPSLAAISPEGMPQVERLLPTPWLLRARHVVSETQRTRSAASALMMGDRGTLGRILFEGHASLRDNYQCSCPEADLLVDSARTHGADGARLTGAGWGGAVILLTLPGHEARIVAETSDDFRKAYGRFPEIWQTRAMGGVRAGG
ncbi:MAG TPA: galactokinase family protein [Gemmatimonadales bacterium]